MGLRTLMLNIKTAMESVKDGSNKAYFDQVWIGMPKKIPMGAKNICIIQPVSDPNFFVSTCPSLTKNDTDIEITMVSMGAYGDAQLTNYDITDAVKQKLYSDETFGGACIDSTPEQVNYGEMVSGTEGKQLQAASNLVIRCRMG